MRDNLWTSSNFVKCYFVCLVNNIVVNLLFSKFHTQQKEFRISYSFGACGFEKIDVNDPYN